MSCPLMIITGDKLRHMYFAQHLLHQFPDAVLVIERQPPESWGAHIISPSAMERRHFQEFAETERLCFSDIVSSNKLLLESRTVCELISGVINTPEAIIELQRYAPRVVATLSTSILQQAFIESFSTIINYHAGLSPYYRGSGTNVFPIINHEPEYIGTTIHYIDTGIDSGNIIVQGRPDFTVGDNSHTLGCKAHMVGTALMAEAVAAFWGSSPPKGFKQDLQTGKLYVKSDFNDVAITKLRHALEAGVVDEYARKGPFELPIITAVTV